MILSFFPLIHETTTFAGEIRALLITAGWMTVFPQHSDGLPPDGVVCEGFSMACTHDKESMAAADALMRELARFSTGGVCAMGNLENPGAPRVQLVVREMALPSVGACHASPSVARKG